MRGILSAGALAFLFAFFGTPAAIRVLVKRGYGQFIRDDGPTTHHTKRGTPTMGGTVIIEQVYSIPGMGRYYLSAVNTHDYPIIQAINILVAFVVVFTNFGVDILYSVLDPRIRYS